MPLFKTTPTAAERLQLLRDSYEIEELSSESASDGESDASVPVCESTLQRSVAVNTALLSLMHDLAPHAPGCAACVSIMRAALDE